MPKRLLLLLLLMLAAPTAAAQSGGKSCGGPLVEAPAGAVCGTRKVVDGTAVDAFLGLPYAESTAGPRRFRAPVPEPRWGGVRDATAFGPVCPQRGDEVAGLRSSENCLSINVWAPASARPRPLSFGTRLQQMRAAPPGGGPSATKRGLAVMVFLHGGGFVHGASSQRLYPGGPALYDGAGMAASQGIVVVTLNYRLGVLGFLAGAPGVTPNLGLLDQRLALQWVQHNIAAFGGDPRRVTLAGESAGAMSAGLQLLSMPASRGLFRSVILESDPFGLPYRTLEQARLGADLLLLHTGCKFVPDVLACLQKLPLATLLRAQGASGQGLALASQGLPAFLAWAPVVDGRVVVRQPFAAALGGGVGMPLLLGTNGSEGTLFFAGDAPLGPLTYDGLARLMVGPVGVGELVWRYPPSLLGDNTEQIARIAGDGLFVCPARAVARASRAAAYLYSFPHVSSFNLWSKVPPCKDRACHGAELPFVFGTAGGKMAFTPAERKLSDAMMAAWGAFVRSGDPSAGAGAPAWPAFGSGGRQLVLDTPLAVAPPGPAMCGYWDGVE